MRTTNGLGIHRETGGKHEAEESRKKQTQERIRSRAVENCPSYSRGQKIKRCGKWVDLMIYFGGGEREPADPESISGLEGNRGEEENMSSRGELSSSFMKYALRTLPGLTPPSGGAGKPRMIWDM